jgi:GR25 family glycosyltransferase involved in LPS biosynthesis
MIAQLDKTKVHYEIVDAVDVRDLDLSDTQLFDPSVNGTSEFANRFRAGSAGSALSHLEVYRRVLDDGLERALVLEDDVTLPADLGALLDAIAQHISGAEVVLLNFHSFEPCQITKAGSETLPSSRLLVQIVDKGIGKGKGEPNSGGAYLITREACERMVRTVIPVRADCDDWPFFYRQGAIDSVRCVVPMPVTNSTALRTSNDYYRPGSLQARVREAVANARIPILKQAMALKRRRNFQRAGCIGRTEFVEELPGGERPSLLCRNP